MRSLGVLMARRPDDPEAQRQYAALIDGLKELGWLEGRNIRLESRWVVGDPPAQGLDEVERASPVIQPFR